MLKAFIRFFFLVKEIISKQGEVHFRRYRLFQLPWFALYIHQICKSDEDRQPHDHPWSFKSLILKGSYKEFCFYPPSYLAMHTHTYQKGDVVYHTSDDCHKITLLSPEVWTLVFVWGRKRTWGYRFYDGYWVEHDCYRRLKNEGIYK